MALWKQLLQWGLTGDVLERMAKIQQGVSNFEWISSCGSPENKPNHMIHISKPDTKY